MSGSAKPYLEWFVSGQQTGRFLAFRSRPPVQSTWAPCNQCEPSGNNYALSGNDCGRDPSNPVQ
jgi:hypothetical protein